MGFRYSLIEKQPSKNCIFLTKGKDGKKNCQIYRARPLQCRTWPFWKENIHSEDSWSETAKKCPGTNCGKWYDKNAIKSITTGDLSGCDMAEPVDHAAINWIIENFDNDDCLGAVSQVYHLLDQYITTAAGLCQNCGRCCDFDKYGHRLYVTTLEILYLLKNGPPAGLSIPNRPAGQCAYQRGPDCSARQGRPSGCRIYHCRALAEPFQNELSEKVLGQLRSLHHRFGAVYHYADLLDWQEKLASNRQLTAARPMVYTHLPKK